MLYENVFYSHKLTGLFTVWADEKQNPGLLNLNWESSEPFAQISSFYRKTATKAGMSLKSRKRILVWDHLTWITLSESSFQTFRCLRNVSLKRPN